MHQWIMRVAIAAVTVVGADSVARSATSPSLAALFAAFKHDAACGQVTHDEILAESPLKPLGQRLDLSTERTANNAAATPLVIPVSYETPTENPLRFSTAGARDAGRRNPLR
jgi:hypothetical protein